MAKAAAPPPGAADSGTGQRMPWRKASNSSFVWSAPSPSPAEVADLELRFPDTVQLPIEELEVEANKWEKNAILARCISRWVPPDAITREFRRGGVAGEVEAISLAHRCFIFRFSECNAVAMTLGRPWVVNGQPIATEAWRPEFVPAANSVSSALLWVRLPQLPLEFWSDSILQSIVRPAGDYQFADTSTMAKARGGFARVCVRIDLSKPLRPGARIRGRFSTFWQQFSYEHLEGICTNCGSLHFSNPCSLSPNPDSPSLSSKFGPWMAALRQRRPPPGAGSDLRRKKKEPGSSGDADPLLSSGKTGASPSKPSLEEGWTVPTKLARRRTMKTGVLTDSPAPGTEAFLDSAGVPVEVKRAGPSETQPESTPNETSLNFEEIQMQPANPFSLFGSAKWAGRPKACMDVRPGPSKRARPEESTSSRAKSKNTKGKGKVSSTASKLPQMIIIPSTIPDPDGLAPNFKGDSGGSSSRVKEAPTILPQQSGSCHDLALFRLKGALQGQGKVCPSQEAVSQGIDTTDSMEATPLVDCSGKAADDRPTDDEMSEDQVGSQSLPIPK